MTGRGILLRMKLSSLASPVCTAWPIPVTERWKSYFVVTPSRRAAAAVSTALSAPVSRMRVAGLPLICASNSTTGLGES